MDSSSPLIENPFTRLQTRYLLFGTFLSAVLVVGIVYALLYLIGWIPWGLNDPITNPIFTIVVLTMLAGAVLMVGWWEGLRLSQLFGDRAVKVSWLHTVLLVLSLLLFSLGSFPVVIYALSLAFPELATNAIAGGPMLGASGSSYPRLYDGLMVFLLLVYAPVVEELIFRGVLLQRWSVKWGLRWGLLGSAVVFGVLHPNPVGLMVFGLVMGLLYVRTRSLWVPVFCHSLNNLAALGLDWILKLTGPESSAPAALEDLQRSWWLGLLPMLVSLPMLWQFLRLSWPQKGDAIPYLLNGAQVEPASVEMEQTVD